MRFGRFLCVVGAVLLLTGLSSPLWACDEGNRSSIEVQAPLDEINCEGVPQTISMLGLTIDVTDASFGGHGRGAGNRTCADLTVGQVAQVRLAGDAVGASTGQLTAKRVKTRGGFNRDVRVVAPIQAVDPSLSSVTVLGLVVDISQAALVNGNKHPIFASQLAAGQFAALTLASNTPPLAATKLRVHIKQIKVEAPVDAIDCAVAPAPQTISMLGLTIDISNATIGSGYGWRGAGATCSDLTVGQTAEVYLAGDVPDGLTGFLTATEVKTGDDGDGDVKINAPLQTVDPNAATVAVLGLAIDISQASLLNDRRHPITASQLLPGQFVTLTLASKVPPLVATKLRVHIKQVKVEAPITAISCEGTPQTIGMLGLTIDVSKASFGSDGDDGDDLGAACADLAIGRTVEVYLTGDVPDGVTGILTATEVEIGDDDDGDVEIEAPLQAIDPNGTSVTVLGLVVDISTATLVDDNEQPITATKLALGQFVDLDLASSEAPLSATELEAQTPTGQIELKVLDRRGKPVTNLTVNNVKAEVTVKGKKRILAVRSTGDGTFNVTGVPGGKTNIEVKLIRDGKTSKGRASFKAKANSNKTVTMRLKAAR